jgi:uncharacterized protein involved in copper resistance
MMRLAAVFGVVLSTAAKGSEAPWFAVIDLAEVQLDRNGQLHWESALYRSFRDGRLHFEFDGDGQAFSEISGTQIQALYEQDVSPSTAVWIGGEHDSGKSPLNTAVLGGCVHASDWLYGETSFFLDSRGRLFHQVKIIASQNVGRDLYLEPRLVLDSSFQDDLKGGRGAGPSSLSLALRLRLKRAHGLAPYAGVKCMTAVGRTATWLRAHGDVRSCGFILGFGARV